MCVCGCKVMQNDNIFSPNPYQLSPNPTNILQTLPTFSNHSFIQTLPTFSNPPPLFSKPYQLSPTPPPLFSIPPSNLLHSQHSSTHLPAWRWLRRRSSRPTLVRAPTINVLAPRVPFRRSSLLTLPLSLCNTTISPSSSRMQCNVNATCDGGGCSKSSSESTVSMRMVTRGTS